MVACWVACLCLVAQLKHEWDRTADASFRDAYSHDKQSRPALPTSDQDPHSTSEPPAQCHTANSVSPNQRASRFDNVRQVRCRNLTAAASCGARPGQAS
ncbi:hypothetical protein BCV70DRAFT_251 [Testicularia cyperi]|uniref:Secreted protein n=1 Tax=Testicularia cyperi TaxID=1882483 RepID=A0A317XYM2_9BASI|nr:hypothetical protein BCV70DRAFT_251 [Testicularia cyperi]